MYGYQSAHAGLFRCSEMWARGGLKNGSPMVNWYLIEAILKSRFSFCVLGINMRMYPPSFTVRNNNNINIYKTQRFTFKPRLRWITQQMMANRLMVNKQCLVPAQRPMDLSGAQSAGNETSLLGRRMMGTGVQVYSDHPDNRTLSGSH